MNEQLSTAVLQLIGIVTAFVGVIWTAQITVSIFLFGNAMAKAAPGMTIRMNGLDAAMLAPPVIVIVFGCVFYALSRSLARLVSP